MKIIIKDNGKIVREKEIRNELHLEVQKKNRVQIFKNKKAYTRKDKYKPNYGNC